VPIHWINGSWHIGRWCRNSSPRNLTCVYCGRESEQWEHTLPTAIRLPDVPEIIVPSCKECNYIAWKHIHSTVGDRIDYVQSILLARHGSTIVLPIAPQELRNMPLINGSYMALAVIPIIDAATPELTPMQWKRVGLKRPVVKRDMSFVGLRNARIVVHRG